MGFRIVTTVSFDYAKAADFCLPSWRKHSGSDDIAIRYHKVLEGNRTERWFRAVKERVVTIRDEVRIAAVEKRKLLILDGDCLVIRNLADGFAGGKPIAVARWPNVNMGVIFLNTNMGWPFLAFFEEYVRKALEHIDEQIRTHVSRNGADQDVFVPMLHAIEHDVAKLDVDEWNLPMSENPDSRKRLEKHKDKVRIIHLRLGTSFGGNVDNFNWIKKELFPEMP